MAAFFSRRRKKYVERLLELFHKELSFELLRWNRFKRNWGKSSEKDSPTAQIYKKEVHLQVVCGAASVPNMDFGIESSGIPLAPAAPRLAVFGWFGAGPRCGLVAWEHMPPQLLHYLEIYFDVRCLHQLGCCADMSVSGSLVEGVFEVGCFCAFTSAPFAIKTFVVVGI